MMGIVVTFKSHSKATTYGYEKMAVHFDLDPVALQVRWFMTMQLILLSLGRSISENRCLH